MPGVGRLIAVTAAAALVASSAFAQVARVTCGRKHDRYQSCSAKTDDEVRMMPQISGVRCEQGKSWGHDKSGVWADHDCSVEFEVGRSGPSSGHSPLRTQSRVSSTYFTVAGSWRRTR